MAPEILHPVVALRVKGVVSDLNPFIVERVAGKSVLNVGAAGNMAAYLPDRPQLSTHVQVVAAAREAVAVDVDEAAISHAARHGVEIHYGDCQALDLGRTFDVVLWLEVIEHLDRPADALNALMRHVSPGGELIITTFNATFIGGFLDSMMGGDMGVFHDHVSCYMPENIKVLAERHGHRMTEAYFYTQMNRFTRRAAIKSQVLRAIGRCVPRFNNAFVAVIRHCPTPAASSLR